MPLPAFDLLRFEDVLNEARAGAHRAGYALLQFIDGISDWEKNQVFQVGTAESLTGGLMFSTLVDIPIGGSYKYGCFGVYDTDAKRVFLGVKVSDVYTHLCARQMAEGVLKNSNASLAIAVTGNARPYQVIDGQSEANKIGEVFIGVACYAGENEIASHTYAMNFCKAPYPAASSCDTWFDSLIEESALSKLPGASSISTRFTDGRNDSLLTSMLSNYIRNKTTQVAFEMALAFFMEQSKNNKFVVPNRVVAKINPDAVPPHACNNNLLVGTRAMLTSSCTGDLCSNSTRAPRGSSALFRPQANSQASQSAQAGGKSNVKPKPKPKPKPTPTPTPKPKSNALSPRPKPTR